MTPDSAARQFITLLLEREQMQNLGLCQIVQVGKQRNGKPRFWCVKHRANATGRYGSALDSCARANQTSVPRSQILDLNPRSYPGGIAIWGAVPAVYSTAQHNFSDLGIHIHARPAIGASKAIDQTFRLVRATLQGDLFGEKVVDIGEEEAVYYMASQVFGYPMRHVVCPKCSFPHLDKDFFAVNPHKRHLCSGCGRHFVDSQEGIGNPLMALKALVGDSETVRKTTKPGRPLAIEQKHYENGIELWGSNQAIIWTSPKPEEEGIHVHCYGPSKIEPEIDETYDNLTIDGILIDPDQLRILMAQQALPHLHGRIAALECSHCHQLHMDTGRDAHTPHLEHNCGHCSKTFVPNGMRRKLVSNPSLAVLKKLEAFALHPRKIIQTGFLPEK